MGNVYNKVLANVDRGIQGLNRGLPMGLPRTSSVINDVQRGRYNFLFSFFLNQ